MEEEVVKKLLELRAYLEERIRQLEEEAEKLRGYLRATEESLADKSFKAAETIPTTPPRVAKADFGQAIPLKTSTGVLLANLYVNENVLKIVPDEKFKFGINVPPFRSFMINRVLESMRAKDGEEVARGELSPDKVLSYDIVLDGDVIREILINNYGGEGRLGEIKSSLRWTLEKMYEKASAPK